MSISAVGSNQQVAYSQFFAGQSVSNQNALTGGTAPAANSGGGNNFSQAINSALSQLGVNSSGGTSSTASASATSSTSSSESPQQALQSFIQSLYAAIQGQVGGQSGGQSAGASTQGVSGSGHHHHHGGGGGGAGKLESGIQSLINQLSSASGSGSTSSTGSTGTSAVAGASSTGTASTSALSALQTSFNTLLSTDGIPSSQTSLTSFLQSLEQNLQGSSTSGNVVKTQA